MSEFEYTMIQLFQELVSDQKKIISLLEGRIPSEWDDPDNWLTPEEAVKMVGVSVRSLYNYRQSGEVRAVKKRGRIRYFKPDILRARDHHLK